MANRIPLVQYLSLDGEPHLVANRCSNCGARFFDRRNACARCGKQDFTKASLPTTGKVTSFTIVQRAAPSVKVPFVSAVIELDDGTSVLANVVDTEPDPEHIQLGMKVKLTTYPVGTDDNGVDAIAFGFAPA